MKKMILSAPFGNYLNFPNATSTLGTFTLQRRGGRLWRAWRVALTVRYNRRQQSWINRLGLPNPGIESLDQETDHRDRIISVKGFDKAEWSQLASRLLRSRVQYVELNLSCPNVDGGNFAEQVAGAVTMLVGHQKTVIAKLPPVQWMKLAVPLFHAGVRHFHCCNTIPSPGGGISGKPLKQYSLWAVEEIKQRWGGTVTVIGGGGIATLADIEDYRKAGADHFAVGSMLLNPLNWHRMKGWKL